MSKDYTGTVLPVGRYSKVSLDLDQLKSIPSGYFVERRLLGIILKTIERRRVRGESVYGQVETLIPVSASYFLLNYNGHKLTIGCHHFSVRATRIIVNWALQAI